MGRGNSVDLIVLIVSVCMLVAAVALAYYHYRFYHRKRRDQKLVHSKNDMTHDEFDRVWTLAKVADCNWIPLPILRHMFVSVCLNDIVSQGIPCSGRTARKLKLSLMLPHESMVSCSYPSTFSPLQFLCLAVDEIDSTSSILGRARAPSNINRVVSAVGTTTR